MALLEKDKNKQLTDKEGNTVDIEEVSMQWIHMFNNQFGIMSTWQKVGQGMLQIPAPSQYLEYMWRF